MQLEQLRNSYKYLYHASIVVNESIYFDPFMIKEETHNAKYVFITHTHYDHLSPDDIDKVINDDTIFIGPIDVITSLKLEGFANKMIEARIGDKTTLIDLKYSVFPAYNREKKYHPESNKWVGYLLEINGSKYYVPGDTDYLDIMDKINCDVLFAPIGGTYTMDYNDGANLANKIKPSIVVPIHCNTLKGLDVDIDEFKSKISENIYVDN